MIEAGNVVILAIRSVRLSSDRPSVGKGEFAAAEAKAVNLETQGCGKDWVTCLAHCHPIHMVYTQVAAVKAKLEVRMEA